MWCVPNVTKCGSYKNNVSGGVLSVSSWHEIPNEILVDFAESLCISQVFSCIAQLPPAASFFCLRRPHGSLHPDIDFYSPTSPNCVLFDGDLPFSFLTHWLLGQQLNLLWQALVYKDWVLQRIGPITCSKMMPSPPIHHFVWQLVACVHHPLWEKKIP